MASLWLAVNIRMPNYQWNPKTKPYIRDPGNNDHRVTYNSPHVNCYHLMIGIYFHETFCKNIVKIVINTITLRGDAQPPHAVGILSWNLQGINEGIWKFLQNPLLHHPDPSSVWHAVRSDLNLQFIQDPLLHHPGWMDPDPHHNLWHCVEHAVPSGLLVQIKDGLPIISTIS